MSTTSTRRTQLSLLVRDRLAVGAAAATLALGAVQLLAPGRAEAAPTDGGRPQVIVPLTPAVPNSGEALDQGGSATAFSLRLAANAACSGDSAADGYRVQSYIVPKSVDPASLRFDANGPTPQSTGATHTQALFDIETTPYVNAQTAQKDDDFQFGRIINIPAFALGNDVWTIAELPAGEYNVGIACTLGPSSADQLDKFFNTVIQVEAAPADPGGFTFSVADNGPPTGGGGSSTTTSTTVAGGSSTTSTTAGGSTTSTTTVSSTSSTQASGGAPTTSSALGSGVGRLPTTGSSTLELVVWGLLLLTVGRIFFLMRRGVRAVASPFES